MGRNWQLLGEVPDSDDEELDSQESRGDGQIEENAIIDGQSIYMESKPRGELVLNILLSPRRENHVARPSSSPSRPAVPRPRTPSPTRLSAPEPTSLPPPDSDDEIDFVYDGVEDMGKDKALSPSSPPRVDIHEEAQEETLKDAQPDDEQISLPQQPVQPQQAQCLQQPRQPQQSQTSQGLRSSQHSPAPHSSQTPRQRGKPEQSDDLPAPIDPFSLSPTSSLSSLSRSPSPFSETLVLQASGGRVPSLPSSFPALPDSPPAFRLGVVRSLRPRKPIQQHPYLLEGAQYAQAMKSHGVKPVRTEYNSAAPRKQVVEEDSQEQEFQQKESQLPKQEQQHDSAFLGDSLYDFLSSQIDLSHDIALSSLSPRTSTPAHRLMPLSSQDAADNGTDNTSLPDEDDFPTPSTFMLRRYKRQQHDRISKRQSSPKTSSAAKRARILDAALQETAPLAKWIPVRMDSSPDQPPRTAARVRLSGYRSPSPAAPSPRREIFTITDDEASNNDNEETGNALDGLVSPPKDVADESQSDSETVRKNGKRIKGVLPASWLRLDQKKAKRVGIDQPTATQRRPGQQSDQAPRKGVALPRQGHGSSLLAALAPIFDDSDDDNDDDNDDSARNNGELGNARRVEPGPQYSEEEGYPPEYHVIDDEDIGSVMEEDTIDRMAPGAKRNRPSNTGGPRPKTLKTRVTNPFSGPSSQNTRQPKITKMINRSASSSTAEHRLPRKQSSSTRQRTRRIPSSRRIRRPPSAPPLLSVLDFVEPAAPDFIRIAARTARSKPRLGKTSPSRKIINLGSRNDNVDALSVLHDWRAGKIKAKVPNPPKRPRQSTQQPPLQELSPNIARNSSPGLKNTSASLAFAAGPAASRKSQSKSFTNGVCQPKPAAPQRPANLRISMTTPVDAMMRPAQLETATRIKLGRTGFVSGKKVLDEMYRRKRKNAITLPNVQLEKFVDDQASNNGTVDGITADGQEFEPMDFRLEKVRQPEPGRDLGTNPERTGDEPRSRFRKRYNPKPVDTSAPRFVHALDPIPLDIGPVTVDLMTDVVDPEADKLRGLGPFGSQYSQHFDIFPLDRDIFFHQSTLIGSGRLGVAFGMTSVDNSQPVQLSIPTPTFQLGERTLSWSTWDDVSSSEFGIVMDWLADALFPSGSPTTPIGPKVHSLINFIVDFIQTTIVSPASSASIQRAFVLRNLEVITTFIGRFESASFQQGTHAVNIAGNGHIAALAGMLAVTTWLLQICRDTPECLPYTFQVENMLQKVSKFSARALLKHGLSDVRASYDDFQRGHFRDRGIRRDMQALSSWVVLMQVLEHAQVPRVGFWDVTYSAMLADKAIGSCTDAGQLEQLWEDMYTLLPLGEFDSSGIVQQGLRQVVPLDGWELPRKALDRVFQLYKANPHQSPSFNAYCRAIVGRCHYLVQEWGWRRCQSIVGAIFDFYGSQDFAHLRNEEVHRSPRFLEELAASPSLAIDADDKCFHIFIKMLGLVILQLKRLNLTKEMTNLVSRVLPNHDRQYLKEKDVHERDLAALRNHHDLLCTLFWAASPDIRPPIHQIEKLVVPANSHKEACLINIRAWNQLARFVIASDEGYGVYRGFSSWMKNIFQQMLDQYLSAEPDMHRQFRNLSKSMMQGIGPDIVKAMAAANQAAAMDVLHACVVSSLDVLRHAKSLGVATYCFNTDQLSAVFTKMDLPSPKADWAILCTALDVVDHYMDRLEKTMDEQYSSSGDTADPQEADDAVLMLDHKLAKSFFRLNNTITHMSWEDMPRSSADLRVACTERFVVVAARLASRFIHSGVYGLSRFFGSGDYCLFERLPHAPGLVQRKFLPLFVSAVIRSNVFDFKDLGTSILELWLLAIVKPQQFLAYENRLAEVLRQHDLPYLRRAYVPTNGQAPSYDTNGAFFAGAMTSMRQQLRDADGATRRQLRGDFARALKLVMQQMKEDLTYAKTEPTEHKKYIAFVRGIVALIRSHGGDICKLDKFFYDQSLEYSPSPEDPQLRTASIVTYGLRLGEGEATAAPQLFHYLHNNFNIALANDELDQECRILERSMENNNVLGFMLGRMLPAILRATGEAGEAWPLLNVYCRAVERFATRSCVPKDIGDENVMVGVVGLLEDIVAWLQWAALMLATDASSAASTASRVATASTTGAAGPSVAAGDTGPTLFRVRLHTMAQLAALANVLQPFLMTCSCLSCPPTTRTRLDGTILGFHQFVVSALADLSPRSSKRRIDAQFAGAIGKGDTGNDNNDDNRPGRNLFSTFLHRENSFMLSSISNSISNSAAATRYTRGNGGPGDRTQVDFFSKKIVQHVQENWVVGDGYISVRKAGARPGLAGAAGAAVAAVISTAVSSDTGVQFAPWTMEQLLGELKRQLHLWKLRPASAYGMGSRARRLFPGRLRETR